MKSFFLTYKNPLTVVIVIIILGGMFSYARLQTALFPEITFPKIKVIADAGQLPVETMMISVTRQLENAIKRVPDLKMLRSITSRGSCEISAFLDWNADVDISQQRIESRINEVRNQLPPGIGITVERMNPSILPVTHYSLESTALSPIDLKLLADYTVKPFLSQVEGVSEVRIIGGKTKEYAVTLDPAIMSRMGITPEQVSTALAATDFIRSNGYLTDYRRMYLAVTDARIRTREDLEKVVVSNNGKRIVHLKDIAAIDIQDAKQYIKVNAGGRESILVTIVKQPNANLIDMSDKMRTKVEDLRKTLPAGVTIQPYYVQADFVQAAVRSVTDSLWVGLALAILVAIFFLRSLRASLVILVTIPVTILLTLICLYAFNQTLNIMTLGAIAAAIGLIIDDAIVVVEQIHRTHEEHPEEHSTSLVQKAIHYLFPAMVGSSLSTIVIFIPFALMTGVAGAYFNVMTDAMITTLICSFFVTWLLLPVIYLLFAGREKRRSASARERSSKEQPWVGFLIRRPYFSFGFIAILAAAAIWVFPRLETGFLPEMDEGSIVLDYNSPAGSSLEETDRILQEVEKIILKVPEVQNYSRRTGTEMGFFITEPNSGDYLIQLKQERQRSTDEVIDDIREQIESSQPALRVDFGQVIGDMLGDLMASVQPIEVKIFGGDQGKLQSLSRQVAEIVSSVDGTADVFDGVVIAGPSVQLIPNYTRLAQFGITPDNLQYQLQSALEGNVAGTVTDPDQLTDIRILYPGNRTLTVDQVRNLPVFLSSGKLKPIGSLARVVVTSGDAEIQREDLQSMGVVTARLDNRDLGSVIDDIRLAVSSKISLPQGYAIVYGGAYAEQQQSFQELLVILILSSLLVFGVILFLFRDFKIALLILGVAIAGITGSWIALFLTGTDLNVGSYTGLIMIVGIIGENAVFTVLQYRAAFRQSGNVDDSIIYAISTRLRPKLMTALGAIIALMPLALGIGTGAQLHQPLAIAVIGGFLAALPLLLIVLPTGMRLISEGTSS